uniref:PCI domain-containing protein n=1 Tax=Anopheles christyi TaxID=43041 RepID=A0A182JWK0_9DIPT
MATNGINESRTSISCENIPELFLDKLTAKMHFSQFGKIKRFILRPNRLSCTVEYEQPEAAHLALERGGQYKNVSFSIYWTDLKPPSVNDNGKPGGASLDLEVQMELEAIDNMRSPSQTFYKAAEQRTAPITTNNRPSLQKVSMPNTARTETDIKIGQARAELETLAIKPAFTAEERYRVLEAKDRYIRLTTERTTDIRKAKNIEGTCPDMCPEKERYLREWKCMVPSYERQPGGGAQIDHVKAIKQYSRSSADQELPLPHELRSQQALGRTMHFLLSHLADLCNVDEGEGGGNVSDWFHYIWDRTREDQYRENMTKCLQTLKYMYTDLAQRDQRCPAEAEFRAYMVLLYLNDGNFLWELRQLPEAIIHSKEIQFALSVYFALEENNFVRFFQLVQSTTYMNACILLRYFTQVRQKALEILRKAYAVRSTASFSLEYMTRILGFEDEEQAEAFFDHYGIMIDQTTEMVLFEPRQISFYQPELPFPTSRAVRLVESKRTVSVGEAICGRPLEQWELQLPKLKQPNDSFHENGCLKDNVLQNAFAERKGAEENNASIIQKQSIKDDQEMYVTEEDKLDSTDMTAQDVPMADHRLFKVPSPTTLVPRVSPRARTPPTKPVSAPFVEQNETSALTPSTFGTLGSKNAQTVEIARLKPSIVAPTTFSNSFEKPVFGTPSSTGGPAVKSFISESGSFFSAFKANPPTMAGGNLFGSVSNAPGSKNDSTDLGDSVTMRYVSPPANTAITPAGQKRAFHGAVKETSAIKPSPPAPSTTSIFHAKPAESSTSLMPSGGSLFGSAGGFGGTALFGKSPTLAVPVISTPMLAGSFFHQPLKEKNDNRENVGSITAIRKEPSVSAEIEKQRDKLKQEEEQRRQEKILEERKQAVERASTVELEKLIDLVVEDLVPEIAEAAVDRHKRIQRTAEELYNELVEELLTTHVPKSAQQEIDRMERLRTARAKKLSEKYFHRWHRNAQSATRWRRLMRTVPPSFVNGSIRMDELPRCDQLLPFLNARCTGSKRSADEVLQDQAVLREVFLFDTFPERKLIDPFVQLECMIHQLQLQASTSILGIAEPIYWKLVLSVPMEGEEGSAGFPSFVSRWLKCCAFRKEGREGCHPYYYLATRSPSAKQLLGTKALSKTEVSQGERAICMRLLQGQSLASEKNTDRAKACNLTDGVLFFLNNRCQIEEARNRLKNVLAKCGSYQPGIAIILYCPNIVGAEGGLVSVDNFEQNLGLTAGLVKRWRVFLWSKGTENDTLREAMNYLANCYRAHMQFESPRYEERLEMRPLSDFMERCVGSELWFRVDKSCRQSEEYTLAGQNANAIVQLYNLAISKVQSMRRNKLIQLLKSLELNPLPDNLQAAIERAAQAATSQGTTMDVTELRTELSDYLSKYRVLITENSYELSTLIQQFLQGIASQLAGYAYNKETQSKKRSADNIRRCYWVPLLALISETILRVLLKRVEDESSNALPHEVCYRRNDFLHLTEAVWWKTHLQQIQKEAQTSTEVSRSNTPDCSVHSPPTSSTTSAPDRKRAHIELSQHNVSNFSLNSDASYSETSFSDSIRSESFHKRPKIVNGVTYSRDIVDDVIAQGMRALARAEEMLSRKHTNSTVLQKVFNPLEQTIQDVEKSLTVTVLKL